MRFASLKSKCFGFYCLFLISACSGIQNGNQLSESDTKRLKKIGLIERNEKIIKFYSVYKKDIAGSFFTNRRMASYWLDKDKPKKTSIHFTYYKDIMAIDTNYMRNSFTYSPYMEVTKIDSTKFKVFAGGKHRDVKLFFEEAIAKWQDSRTLK